MLVGFGSRVSRLYLLDALMLLGFLMDFFQQSVHEALQRSLKILAGFFDAIGFSMDVLFQSVSEASKGL